LSGGFKLDGESNVLRNPLDNHTLLVFNPLIRGQTDQFAFRFRATVVSANPQPAHAR
jgi:predicted methyltransferase